LVDGVFELHEAHIKINAYARDENLLDKQRLDGLYREYLAKHIGITEYLHSGII
jgi:hypothetical protein